MNDIAKTEGDPAEPQELSEAELDAQFAAFASKGQEDEPASSAPAASDAGTVAEPPEVSTAEGDKPAPEMPAGDAKALLLECMRP